MKKWKLTISALLLGCTLALAQTTAIKVNSTGVQVDPDPASKKVTLYFLNSGVKITDSNASHYVSMVMGSNVTADRTFTILSGDDNRTLDISAANVTISSFFAGLLDDTSGTGTGAVVLANAPTLITPDIGAATGTSLLLNSGYFVYDGLQGLVVNDDINLGDGRLLVDIVDGTTINALNVEGTFYFYDGMTNQNMAGLFDGSSGSVAAASLAYNFWNGATSSATENLYNGSDGNVLYAQHAYFGANSLYEMACVDSSGFLVSDNTNPVGATNIVSGGGILISTTSLFDGTDGYVNLAENAVNATTAQNTYYIYDGTNWQQTAEMFNGTMSLHLDSLKLNSGSLSIASAGETLTADNQVVSVFSSFIRLTSNNATASNRTFTLYDGVDGQILTIHWIGTNAGELLDSGTYKLNGAWTPTEDDTITLQWDFTSGVWRELSRSTN